MGIICPFPVEIGLTILKIRVRQMLGCLTIDYAPEKHLQVRECQQNKHIGSISNLNIRYVSRGLKSIDVSWWFNCGFGPSQEFLSVD